MQVIACDVIDSMSTPALVSHTYWFAPKSIGSAVPSQYMEMTEI